MATSREYLIGETIKAKWDGTAALGVSCPGGLKFVVTKQPADTSAISEPYCNYRININSVRNQAGTGVQIITAMVTFDVYGAVAEEVSDALGDIQTTFAWGTFLNDPTGGKFHDMKAEPSSRIQHEMWSRGGAINWNGTHTVKIVISL